MQVAALMGAPLLWPCPAWLSPCAESAPPPEPCAESNDSSEGSAARSDETPSQRPPLETLQRPSMMEAQHATLPARHGSERQSGSEAASLGYSSCASSSSDSDESEEASQDQAPPCPTAPAGISSTADSSSADQHSSDASPDDASQSSSADEHSGLGADTHPGMGIAARDSRTTQSKERTFAALDAVFGGEAAVAEGVTRLSALEVTSCLCQSPCDRHNQGQKHSIARAACA